MTKGKVPREPSTKERTSSFHGLLKGALGTGAGAARGEVVASPPRSS